MNEENNNYDYKLLEEQDQVKERYILVNKDGKVICVDSETLKLEYQDLSGVTIDNMFPFWSVDLGKLKRYIHLFSNYNELNPFQGFDVDSEDISFLEVVINEEDDTFYLC